MNTTEKVGYTWHKIYIVGRKLHILSLLQPFPTHIRKQMSHSRDIWHYYKNSYNSKNYAIRLSTLQTIAIRLHRLTAILRCLVRQLFLHGFGFHLCSLLLAGGAAICFLTYCFVLVFKLLAKFSDQNGKSSFEITFVQKMNPKCYISYFS